MHVKTIIVGELSTNCYLLIKNEEVLIIDPGAEEEKIIDSIENKQVVGIIITHHHNDHIGVLNKIVQKYKCRVFDSKDLEEGETNIDSFNFEVIKTPGHTSDSITIYFKDINSMFVGDFVFNHTIGRTDLPSGNFGDMKKSIEKIKKYPIDTILYPGHGIITTIDEEINNSIYFK